VFQQLTQYRRDTLEHFVKWAIANTPLDIDEDYLNCDLCKLSWWQGHGWAALRNAIDLVRTSPDAGEAAEIIRILSTNNHLLTQAFICGDLRRTAIEMGVSSCLPTIDSGE